MADNKLETINDYVGVEWINGSTPLNQDNLNKSEEQLRALTNACKHNFEVLYEDLLKCYDKIGDLNELVGTGEINVNTTT